MILRLVFLFVLLHAAAAYGQDLPKSKQPSDLSNVPTNTKKGRSGKGSIFLNDSTHNVYGPNTTLSITEEDLFYNRLNYKPLDTGIINLHRWTYVQRFNHLYQDLGNMGTALNSIYPVVRDFSGAVSGFNAYRLYFDTQYPKYFDTKSPYAKINLVWGGLGRAMTDIQFARNINPRWNFGFSYRPILVDKQLQRKRRGDRQVTGQYYDFHTSYKSKDEKYLVLFNFRRTRHRVFETGGIDTTKTKVLLDYFDKQANPALVAAQTQQFLRNYHLYNQYSLANALQLYATVDWNRESNNFTDNTKSENAYGLSLFDHWEKIKATDTTKKNDIFRFSTFQTEAGLKGRAGLLFYNAYYKIRTYSTYFNHDNSLIKLPKQGFDGSALLERASYQSYLNVPPSFTSNGIEHYLGGRVALDIDSLTRLSGVAEINQLGNYSIDAKFNSKLVDATFLQSISRPGFVYNQYRGSHDFWSNSFKNITGLKMEAFLKTPFKKFLIAPGLSYTLINNYVYFRKDNFSQQQTVLPVQSASLINVANPQIKLGVYVTRKIKLSGNAINTIVLSDAEGAMQIPKWLVNGQLALEDYWFTKHLQVQVGFDVSWRSAYKAMDYDIAIQQYYVQQKETVAPAFIGDVFLNARLLRGRIFVKYHNIAQAFLKTGYFPTPGYTGQRNVLDFGFELVLFD